MWQDAHRPGGRDEIGWGRGEDVGEAVSEGRREALGCSVQVAWRPRERQRSHSSGALRRGDRKMPGSCGLRDDAFLHHKT